VSKTIAHKTSVRRAKSNLLNREFERILLIKPSALGDVIHSIPVLVKLRARYPLARIDWLLTPENAEIIRTHPALSNTVLFPRRQFSASGFIRLLRQLRQPHYDLVIDLHGQLRSAFFALATGAAVRIGFAAPGQRRPGFSRHGWVGARECSWLAYTHRIPIRKLDVHAIDRYLWLGDLVGFDDNEPDTSIYVPGDAKKKIDYRLGRRQARGQPLAVLVPGTVWETKHWTISGFSEVARGLKRDGFLVALAGVARDRPRCRAIAAAAPGTLDLCGETSPVELTALIQRANICVTNDSGSMHMAVALNRPVVSVFGPTNPVHVGPHGHPESVVRLGLECSPCNFRKLSQCPHDHACLRGTSGEMVLERVRQLLRHELPSESECGSPTTRSAIVA
jgi:heptosyltransferase I